jgi:hypothetical protein
MSYGYTLTELLLTLRILPATEQGLPLSVCLCVHLASLFVTQYLRQATLRHTLTELRHTLTDLRHTLTELRHTLTELCYTLTELRHTLTELRDTLMNTTCY